MDGKYFFVSKKDMAQAWSDADLVFRANLPSAEEMHEEAVRNGEKDRERERGKELEKVREKRREERERDEKR